MHVVCGEAVQGQKQEFSLENFLAYVEKMFVSDKTLGTSVLASDLKAAYEAMLK